MCPSVDFLRVHHVSKLIGHEGLRVAALGAIIALSGCFPAGGPTSASVMMQASSESAPYALVKLSQDVVSTVGHGSSRGFRDMRGGLGASPKVLLGIGDIVSITIFEAATGGLFIPESSGARPGNFVTIPDQSVDNSGNITMPYAGSIRAAGRSIPDIQEEIVAKLRDRAIEPQVVVTLKEQKATQVSVLGAVRNPSRFPINPSGDRLLDVIAKAGGPEFAGYDTYVTLQRGKQEATLHFNILVNSPGDNIYVRAGDTIVLNHEPQAFVALGASGKNGQIPFEAERISLAEAFGKAGGLLDSRADPTYVFVYRLEDRETLQRAGHDTSRFGGEIIPTIYMADVRSPAGYFLATNFDVEDKDVVYIANAPTVNIGKVFAFVRGATSTVENVTNLD
jgi:polysaccharide export outer membrane protein